MPRPGSKQMERMKDFAKSPPKRGRHTDSTYTTGTDSQRGTQSDGSRLINASTSKDGGRVVVVCKKNGYKIFKLLCIFFDFCVMIYIIYPNRYIYHI